MTSKEALSKLEMQQPPATGQENYQYLTSVWQKNMCTFKDFLRSYNNKDVVLTAEAMQKLVGFCPNSGFHILKLGCCLPYPANIRLHKSTTAKF